MMVQVPAPGAFQVLDWIVSRHVHEYFDVAGRPVGEGRAAAFQRVQTEMQRCPYAGSRDHHSKPMNVSALRQIVPVWDDIVAMLSWLSQRSSAWRQRELKTYDDLSLVASAGVFLADFLALRSRRPLRSGEIPRLISGLYKVCLGFQLATFLAAMRERCVDERPPSLPDAAGFYADLEAQELLIGEAEVCSGPPAMIMQAYDAMTGGNAVAQSAPPPACGSLEIAWDSFDLFMHSASNIWSDLVQYVLDLPQYFPELSDPRLPTEVQHRLNACLAERKQQLLAEQSGLVVDIAHGAQEFCGRRLATAPPQPSASLSPSPSRLSNTLAETVLAWLKVVAPDEMRNHASVVKDALQSQLAGYVLFEATVVNKLNQNVNCLMDSLGWGQSSAELNASTLSHVCGRTIRDWSAASQ